MTANTADEENYGVDRPSDLKHVDIGRTSSIEVGDIVPPRNDAGYRRALHARQIMMLAFGGGIGTGLWVGTGTALARGMSILNVFICQVFEPETDTNLQLAQQAHRSRTLSLYTLSMLCTCH